MNQSLGQFYIKIEGRFESAHYLYNYYPDGSDEEIHGHSWKVEVFLASETNLREDGISYDFLQVRLRLDKLVKSIDHILINKHKDFENINPTSENVSLWFYKGLIKDVKETGGKIKRIVIHEGPENFAYFEPSEES
ncbi:MAG: 6-carboxytetrahydropterin synthase [Leptospiraceae bacterium]|nr:6-carboxytetrahydropterin synthase [Leptospiraceae bacterium]